MRKVPLTRHAACTADDEASKEEIDARQIKVPIGLGFRVTLGGFAARVLGGSEFRVVVLFG